MATTKSKTKVTRKRDLPSMVEDTEYNEEEIKTMRTSGDNRKKYLFTLLAVFIVVALAGYKFKYLLIPAKVGNQPVFVWQYVSYLHKTYGKEALQTLTTQKLIEQEIAKSKVVVKSEDVQKEIDSIDKQASASGGITAMLAAQQMTMDQLKDQIRIQLAVKQILKDKIFVSDAEINDAYIKNKDFFKGVSETDAKGKVRDQLQNQKFQTEAGAWLAEIRKNTPIVIMFPGLQ